jgi:hypothetical protein
MIMKDEDFYRRLLILIVLILFLYLVRKRYGYV